MAHLGKPLLVIQIAPTLRGQTRGKLMMEKEGRREFKHPHLNPFGTAQDMLPLQGRRKF